MHELVHKEEQMTLSLAIFLAQQKFLDLNWNRSAGSVPGLSEISVNFIPLHNLTLAVSSLHSYHSAVLLTGKCHSYTNELQSWNYSFESLHVTYAGIFVWLPVCITIMFGFFFTKVAYNSAKQHQGSASHNRKHGLWDSLYCFSDEKETVNKKSYCHLDFVKSDMSNRDVKMHIQGYNLFTTLCSCRRTQCWALGQRVLCHQFVAHMLIFSAGCLATRFASI